LVLRFPTAILAASIQIVAFISLTAGIILDSVCHSRRQAKRLVYLALPPPGLAPGPVRGAELPAAWPAPRGGA
jgi:hypothetical protein